MLSSLANLVKEACLSLTYPPKCLHCKTPHLAAGLHLCEGCVSLLSLLEAQHRCRHCFVETGVNSPLCHKCRHSPSFLKSVACACEYQGPIQTLLCNLKYGSQAFLAKSLAALMTAQFVQLEWEIPDLIVPVPISWMRKLDRGFNQCELLAQEMGKFLECPVRPLLKRTAGDWSQAGLSHSQREDLSPKSFLLTSHEPLYGKTILLIDDVLTTGTTLHHCAETLAHAYPTKIYGLTLAKA